jgi:hypothetical protein
MQCDHDNARNRLQPVTAGGIHAPVSDQRRCEQMAFGNKMFEQVINWRIANDAFRNPKKRFGCAWQASVPASELVVYLPHDRTLDVRLVRDWLHDPDNNHSGYTMVGCFRDSMITGIKFLFTSSMDAVMFRLSFSGIAAGSP